MREPLVIHCQCVRECREWIHVEERESDLVGAPGLRFVLPGHALPEDRIWEIRPGYLIVEASKAHV
jgi:hypothetical protein